MLHEEWTVGAKVEGGKQLLKQMKDDGNLDHGSTGGDEKSSHSVCTLEGEPMT